MLPFAPSPAPGPRCTTKRARPLPPGCLSGSPGRGAYLGGGRQPQAPQPSPKRREEDPARPGETSAARGPSSSRAVTPCGPLPPAVSVRRQQVPRSTPSGIDGLPPTWTSSAKTLTSSGLVSGCAGRHQRPPAGPAHETARPADPGPLATGDRPTHRRAPGPRFADRGRFVQGALAIDFRAGPDRVQDPDGSEYFGPQRALSRDLPDPAAWVTKMAQALVEVLSGARPAPQLIRWTTPEVYSEMARRNAASGRRPVVARRALVRRVRICEPADGGG
jgi:hypothetical protein